MMSHCHKTLMSVHTTYNFFPPLFLSFQKFIYLFIYLFICYKVEYFPAFTAMLQQLFLLMAEFTFMVTINLLFARMYPVSRHGRKGPGSRYKLNDDLII